MTTLSPMALSATLMAAACLALPVTATADDGSQSGRITVSGTGTAEIAPDMAIINLSVVEQADTARDALDANTSAMSEVLEAMKGAGIEERDLQTAMFQIMPRYENKRKGQAYEQEIIGYEVRNSLTVRVRDLTKLGSVLDRSVTLGVNQGGAVQFTNDDPSAAIEDARTKAMQNAIAKARLLTETAGIGLGAVLEINEHDAQPQPRAVARADMALASSAEVPIAAGENSYAVTVNVTWELAQ